MRRPTGLTVATDGDSKADMKDSYELRQSFDIPPPPPPPPPAYDEAEKGFSTSTTIPTTTTTSASAGPEPSLRLLFVALSRRESLLFLLPAIITSILAGGIAPFMTRVVGNQFNVFAAHPLHNATAQDNARLLHGVGIAALELLALAVGALVLSSITSSLWICAGERNVAALRKDVFARVAGMEMAWFDTQLGNEGASQAEEGPVGAGGLMAKFARETDEVRSASSLASGFLLQYLTTTFACLALAFSRSWSLTLVILSAVPVLMIVQVASQVFAGPPLNQEREETAVAATLVDRAVAAIATVKAFNAQASELATISRTLDRVRAAADKCNSIWGFTSGLSQFTTYAMFVQGFWFGARQVRSGHITAGDVMAVFWACLIATSNLQMAVPQLVMIAKGKFAAAALASTANAADAQKSSGKSGRRLRKIQPRSCAGELELHNVSFAYPSRPEVHVLSDCNLFFSAGDFTFVVGGSGSGKSTIAQILMRMYTPSEGSALFDEQEMAFLDEAWTRQQIACVSQQTILFDRSVHDNVAMGLAGPGSLRRPEHATREEVIDVCRAAMIHDFIRDLPEGYDTMLGTNGANLSGGQKQRLAIARALLRNPTVLILDEATSALDATSRVLVFEAIKRQRRNMTTIVITHDLSQIVDDDFVYVLKHGRVVEQGFRHDLESDPFSAFRDMADTQAGPGGFPVRQLDAPVSTIIDDDFVVVPRGPSRLSVLPGARASRLTLNNWMFDAVQDLSSKPRQSRFVPMDAFAQEEQLETPRRRVSFDLATPTARAFPRRRLSLQFSPTSATFNLPSPSATNAELEYSATQAQNARTRVTRQAPVAVVVDAPAPSSTAVETQVSFWRLMLDIYPTVHCKALVLAGLVFCLLSGAMTPVFSFLLSRVMYEVSIGAKHLDLINWYGAAVLGAAAADGVFMGLKFYLMEKAAMAWVTDVRKRCLQLVLAQDKKWFDKTQNAPHALVQILIKDGDDARGLIATVLGQLVVVTAMLSVGLVWALVWGWQLTLVGLAVAPVFAMVMALQTRLVSNCELRNKRAKEAVAKSYYETILNIRTIRAMGFEEIFKADFATAAAHALKTGVRGAFVEGISYGLASALIYLAEAVLFYTGAVLVAKGMYTYLQMINVLNLVVFTVTIGAQLMTFTERIAKSTQAARDFNRLLQLESTTTDESKGTVSNSVHGHVHFDNVHFSYPERSDVPVLQGLTLDLAPGELVAVVGASGCGKSTVAALLQRLYEPSSGHITLDNTDLLTTDVRHLRQNVSVVSQQANLFDTSVAENIAYGLPGPLNMDVVTRAAMDAHAHTFVSGLPNGYNTLVGENASQISGGQAQRLQIARALARPSRVLVLDECTSALDGANQVAVLRTVREAAQGRATMMITHKLAAMRMCDRIVLLHEGRVAEEGSFEELTQRKGLFTQLARGGEWES